MHTGIFGSYASSGCHSGIKPETLKDKPARRPFFYWVNSCFLAYSHRFIFCIWQQKHLGEFQRERLHVTGHTAFGRIVESNNLAIDLK